MKKEKNAKRFNEKTFGNAEGWLETSGKEEITIVKFAGITTRIDRKKFHNALEKIVDDSAMRARLEANPAATMAELGIEIDDKERAALAGKRLSEALSMINKADLEARGVAIPQVISEAITSVLSYPDTSVNAVTETTTQAVSSVTVYAPEPSSTAIAVVTTEPAVEPGAGAAAGAAAGVAVEDTVVVVAMLPIEKIGEEKTKPEKKP